MEEHGDIRGGYLRLPHQLSQIPLRLAQLRQQIDPVWLLMVSKRRRLVLVWFAPAHKINAIKLVREITNLGLKEAKELVETAPATIKDGLTMEEAEQLVERFRGIAVVAVEASAGK